MDKVKNDDVRKMCGMKKLLGKLLKNYMNECLFRWYSHVRHMTNDRMVKMTYGSTAESKQRGKRLQKKWTDAVSTSLMAGVIPSKISKELFLHAQESFCV